MEIIRRAEWARTRQGAATRAAGLACSAADLGLDNGIQCVLPFDILIMVSIYARSTRMVLPSVIIC